SGAIPVVEDPDATLAAQLQPDFLVDAILAKRNLGTNRQMAPVTIGLGPGFTAPDDVDAVVETMRGHILGRVILQGSALADTGMPGLLGGKTAERVVHAPCGGTARHHHTIGDQVKQGETLFFIDSTPVPSPLDGILRGLIADGMQVKKGLKCADVDPRDPSEVDYTTISDKARCIGGAVLEACLMLGRQKNLLPPL
ncbi:EF2563 family selenium-dependent molybdenum hydroxylase system protein, partial [Ruminococcaceae bacterium OttesenSCG-928-I18]|nr:EF2563 family selenium-dependent molybdenum hydroxylase system protein [Ruminococcaceae bacterium OttesenSCG-928-I18]